MEVENQVDTMGMEEGAEKIEAQTDCTAKESTEDVESSSEVKKNGTLAGLSSAAASNAAQSSQGGVIRPHVSERVHTSGIIVQFPEMFSLKRDRHILDKFSNALDVRMQKCAFIECESEEVAAQLQSKLNGTSMNNKKVNAYRLDLNEKISLYTSNLKKETTDDFIKETYPGVEEILREKFSVFIKFSSETECRAARTKIMKEGVNGQKVHCDFDMKRDRFNKPQEPEAKKQKLDEEAMQQEGGEGEEAKKEEGQDEGVPGEEGVGQEGENATADPSEDVKADEW